MNQLLLEYWEPLKGFEATHEGSYSGKIRSISKFTPAKNNGIMFRKGRILDTHMGSQSSRIAAYKLGFDYYGFEIDETYFSKGCERFEQVISEPLFDEPKQPEQSSLFNAA